MDKPPAANSIIKNMIAQKSLNLTTDVTTKTGSLLTEERVSIKNKSEPTDKEWVEKSNELKLFREWKTNLNQDQDFSNYQPSRYELIGFRASQTSLNEKWHIQNIPELREKADEDYICKQCFDTEEVAIKLKAEGGLLFRGSECKCVAKKKQIIEQRERQKRIKNIIKSSGISKENNGKKFRQYNTPNPSYEIALDNAKAYAKNFTDILADNGGVGLTISGNVGSGKTFLVELIAQEIMKDGYTCLMNTAYDLWQEIANTYSDYNNNARDLIKQAQSVDLLILDNLNIVSKSQKFSSDFSNKMFSIINHRYNQNLPILVTTTEVSENLGGYLSVDITSRLKERNRFIRLNSIDFREINKQKTDGLLDHLLCKNQ